ncbi:MAG: 2-oxoacid:acceptor oxidoreductase subunit alpha [Planctomycetes bacterium]|nr:2-oxoacid:acceptor oxidoreductase subunit alpha [Planctomycetota bacterium]
MGTATEIAPSAAATYTGETIVNDLVIEVATSNGTGSQSANLVLMRSIFRMGVPVGAKNLFPSNIQGLPTWFTIRANGDGWIAKRVAPDVFIAMNEESVEDDLAKLRPGAVLLLRTALKGFLKRNDLIVYECPFDEMVKDVDVKLRKMVVNMAYVGVVGWLLNIEMEAIDAAIHKQFAAKAKAAEINVVCARKGWAWAAEHLRKKDPFLLRRLDKTKGKIIVEGNNATALGLTFGGCTFLAWYPITPSSTCAEALIDYLSEHRKDAATGKATFCAVQAEDELGAIGMVVGAGWVGARACTTTSGPGISLMSEIAGLSYFAEIPAVIVDVQRMGPSTGLPTRTCQGDMLKAYYLSHGDTKHILFIPKNPKEAFEMGSRLFDVAEHYQTLVFMMTDLDLGMNYWMSDRFEMPTHREDRGKVLTAADLDRLGQFARYKDVDGDGICYRTLPGTDHDLAAYFTRGTGHTERATYTEKPADWQRNMDRLARKFETVRRELPPPEEDLTGSPVGVIAYGTSDEAVAEARHLLRLEEGLETDYLRVLALPAHVRVKEFLSSHRVTYVVEQNRDAQMRAIFAAEFPESASRVRSVLHYSGDPIDARSVVEGIVKQEKR